MRNIGLWAAHTPFAIEQMIRNKRSEAELKRVGREARENSGFPERRDYIAVARESQLLFTRLNSLTFGLE